MFDSYFYYQQGTAPLILSNLPSGLYDFTIYGHGNADNQNTTRSMSLAATTTSAEGVNRRHGIRGLDLR